MSGQTFECIVSADLFARAMVAVSKDDARYYLCGVHVEPVADGGALLVATDGKRLIALHDPEGVVPNGSGIVTLNKAMAKALTAPARSLVDWTGPERHHVARPRRLVVRNGRAAIVSMAAGFDADMAFALADSPNGVVGAFQWFGAVLVGNFPDWRRVIGEPDNDAAHVPVFDLGQAAPLAKSLVGEKSLRGVRIIPTKGTQEGPIYLFPADGGQGFAVVMPLRGFTEARVYRFPSWATRPAQDRAA